MQDYTYLGIYASMVPGFEKNASWLGNLGEGIGTISKGLQGTWTAGRTRAKNLSDAISKAKANTSYKDAPDELAKEIKRLQTNYAGTEGGAFKTMKNQLGNTWNAMDPGQRNALTQAGLGAAGIGGFGAGAALL